MIHEIGRELEARLLARGAPFKVLDGPERTKPATWGRERIVVEHDPDGGDSFAASRTQSVNPKIRRRRIPAYVLTIYVKSPAPGASVFEHRRRAEHALDMVLVALDEIAAARGNQWEPGSGGFFVPEELEGSERPNGAAYALKFKFDRAVEVRTWAGAKQTEFTFGANGMRSTTKVSRSGVDDDGDPSTVPADAETACGA